jgi:serine/threonine-protein kinase RsbW
MGDDLHESRARRPAKPHDGADRNLRLPAVARSAGIARDEARVWCRDIGGGDRLDQVLLAVTEAVANVVVHAYPNRTDGDIALRFRMVAAGVAEVSVRDFGVGRRRAPPTSRPHLGLGLIDMMADHAEVRDAEPGTHVCMQFRI